MSEARYETRRAAHVTFSAVLFAEIEKVHDFMDAHGDQTPGDYQHEGPIAALDEPFNLVRIIGPSDVAEAAHKARYELNWWAFGNGSAAEATKAAEQYLDSARRLLKFDID